MTRKQFSELAPGEAFRQILGGLPSAVICMTVGFDMLETGHITCSRDAAGGGYAAIVTGDYAGQSDGYYSPDALVEVVTLVVADGAPGPEPIDFDWLHLVQNPEVAAAEEVT